MQLRILGPFEVCDDTGTEVKIPAGRERALLAVLALRRGEVVSIDALVDALWGERPPSTAAKAVQGYVSHLRRLFEADGGATDDVIVTQHPGYALRIDAVQVDAARFERLAHEGRRALEDDDPSAALELLDGALALWRGSVLAEFAFEEFAQREIQRLDELRLSAIEDRNESLLALGRHAELVSALGTLVETNPLRERLRGQLMLALYRTGRQADALDVYRKGRRLLAQDLGLDPGAELQRLEKAILAHDPALAPPELCVRPARAHEPGAQRPPGAPRRGRVRYLVMCALLLVVAVAGVTAGYLLVRDDAPASIVVNAPALVAIDPVTNRVVASIPMGSRPVTLAAGAGSIWVGDARDGTITRVDERTRRVVRTIGIGAPVVDLAFGFGAVWAATSGFGEVVRIEPELGAVVDRIPLADPDDPIVPTVAAVDVGEGRVWIGVFDKVVPLDPRSGKIGAAVATGTNVLQLAVGDGAVWATTIGSRAKRIEASSSQETAEFYAGNWVYPVAVGNGAVWVGGYNGQIWKLDPATGGTTRTSRAGADVGAIAVGDDAVWATSFAGPMLVRLDTETGEVEATIDIGGPSSDIAVSGGLVWVPIGKPGSN